MCSVVSGQVDHAMHAELNMTKDWDANSTDLLFILKAVQTACVIVHVVAHDDRASKIVACGQPLNGAITLQTV